MEVPHIGCEEEGNAAVEVVKLFGPCFGYECYGLGVAVGCFSDHREELFPVGADVIAFIVLCCPLSSVVDAEAPVCAADCSVRVEYDIRLCMGEPW